MIWTNFRLNLISGFEKQVVFAKKSAGPSNPVWWDLSDVGVVRC